MLPIKEENLTSLIIDFKLTNTQRAMLFAFIQQEGFDVVQLLFEEEIRKLHVHHMNSDVADKARQEATFILAKSAAMVYKGFISRLEEELNLSKYNAAKLGTIDNPEQSADITE